MLEKIQTITLEQIRQADKAGYDMIVIVNGEYYKLNQKGDTKK